MHFVLVALHPDFTHAFAMKDIMEQVFAVIVKVSTFKYLYGMYANLRSFLRKHVHNLVCPNGTYWHSTNLCKPCPDLNEITLRIPSANLTECVCKHGFQRNKNNSCEVISCPPLKTPHNGYFIRNGCGNVINTACGVRCISGYYLEGSSIRLCQQNGSWSGDEAKCVCKY